MGGTERTLCGRRGRSRSVGDPPHVVGPSGLAHLLVEGVALIGVRDSPEQVSALYGIPVYEDPGESPEARFQREAREAAETNRLRSILERLRVLEREKAE